MNGYWKLLIGLIDSLSGKERSNLLNTVIDLIGETGTHLKLVIYDGTNVNTTIYTSLRVKFDLEINKSSYFFNSNNKKKFIFMIRHT